MDGLMLCIVSQRLEPAPGVLYVVGTPIGHLGDLSPRAEAILKNSSTIVCEDTRHSGKLLIKIGSKVKKLSFHKHNAQKRLPQIIALLEQGNSIAMISDAGLPGISDPGEELVNAVREAGNEVICIPGPCAATTALVSSGLPSNRFCFEGFLPSKGKDRKERLKVIAKEERTTVLYEAPHRVFQILEELKEICGESRGISIARELTKRHEQHIGPTIKDALTHFQKHKPIGELTIVLAGAEKQIPNKKTPKELLIELKNLINKGKSASEAAKELSQKSGESRRMIYSLLHKTNPPESS